MRRHYCWPIDRPSTYPNALISGPFIRYYLSRRANGYLFMADVVERGALYPKMTISMTISMGKNGNFSSCNRVCIKKTNILPSFPSSSYSSSPFLLEVTAMQDIRRTGWRPKISTTRMLCRPKKNAGWFVWKSVDTNFAPTVPSTCLTESWSGTLFQVMVLGIC